MSVGDHQNIVLSDKLQSYRCRMFKVDHKNKVLPKKILKKN